MANIQSQKKRNRQNEKNRQRNIRMKSTYKTASKKVLAAVNAKEGEKSPEAILELFKKFQKTIDTISSKGVLHWKKAARLKSRMSKKVKSVTA